MPSRTDIRQHPEGEVFTAGRYLGDCPDCGGRLNYGNFVVRAGDAIYCVACRKPRLSCRLCSMPVSSGLFCSEHYPVGQAFLMFLQRLRERWDTSPWPLRKSLPEKTYPEDQLTRMERGVLR